MCVCVLAQIWWSLASSTGSKLFAHDLATTTTSELQSFQSGVVPAVTCMQVDTHGYVWLGFKGGMLQVWDADRRACLCRALDMAPADIRWAIWTKLPSAYCSITSCASQAAMYSPAMHLIAALLTHPVTDVTCLSRQECK